MRWLPLVVCFSISLIGCQTTPTGRIAAGYAQMTLEGQAGLENSSGNAISGRVDLHDDLGLDEPSGTLYVEGQLEWFLGRLGASAFRYDQTGTGVLSSDFGDIGAGTPVQTDVTLWNAMAYWAYDIVDIGYLRFAPGIAVDVFDLDAKVASLTAISVFERIEVFTPVPMLYGQLEGRLGPVGVQVDGGWMSIDLGDVEGTWWDLEGRVTASLDDRFDVFAGYRHIDLDTEGVAGSQRFDADIQLGGWFVGAGVRF
jgi:hypothetical protein